MNPIKVSELNKYIKKYISMDYLLSDIKVKGEISNLKFHSNGNIYFSLKDNISKINGIIYKLDAVKINFPIKNGDNIIAKGSISVFDKDASITFFIRNLETEGIGELYKKYLELKEKLYLEGLFDESHKKKIPIFPNTVGIVTSETGAAIRDIIDVIQRRNSSINLILYPANVQGNDSANQIIKGINYFNNHPVDVIIIGRGGGSYEELFSFNDEYLARTIYNSEIPIISAVGHEVDYFLSDFASDLRAATPSVAAEMVSISKNDLNNMLEILYNKLNNKIINNINNYKKNLDYLNFKNNKLINSIINKEKNKLINKYNKFQLLMPNINIKREYLNIQLKLMNKLILYKFEDRNYLKNLYNELNNNILNKLNFKKNECLEKFNILEKYNDKYRVLIYQNKKNILSIKELNEENLISIKFPDGIVKAEIKKIYQRGINND